MAQTFKKHLGATITLFLIIMDHFILEMGKTFVEEIVFMIYLFVLTVQTNIVALIAKKYAALD